ncbi:MAG TPA: hypothetical protein VEH49_07350 [Methylomirabilota bacterium]|nr:hypothetical protein [Methylomirabilota bacterium]
MSEERPTHAQGDLQLKLYDLRREAKLRQARDWFNQNYFADTVEEAMRVAPFGSQEGIYFMMVVSYWDQACAYLNHGLLHEELFFETSGEFFGVWDRVRTVVPMMREMFHQKLFLANLEKAALRWEKWMEHRSPGALEAMRGWIQQMRSSKAQKAASA